MRALQAVIAFNRGLISRKGLSRVDIERALRSAEVQTNWMPRTLGSMSFRPGLRFIGETRGSGEAYTIPFVNEIDDQARIEMVGGGGASCLRVWVDDALISRAAVSSMTTNGDFTSSLADWTDADESGAASQFGAGGTMDLLGSGSTSAIRWQQVAITASQRQTEHAVRIVVTQGPVVLEVGSAPETDNVLRETVLGTGTHSLAFNPAGRGSVFITVRSQLAFTVKIDSIKIETAGAMEVPLPYTTADLDKVRWAISEDVIFLACSGYEPHKIERRAATSWSVVKFQPNTGPFRDENTSGTTISADDDLGDITLTASARAFNTQMVGTLFRLASSGQQTTLTVVAENQFTSPGIRVVGVGDQRKFIAVASATSSTVTLQRAVGEDSSALYEDVQAITAGTSVTIDDELDNQEVFYRIGVKTGDFVNNAPVRLTYSRGSIEGVVRLTKINSAFSADAIVLSPLGGTTASAIWSEGEWSQFRGYPTAVALFDGRLWWAGQSRLWGSASDAFDDFNIEIEGDAAAISKAILGTPAKVVTWLAAGLRLMIGTVGGVLEARASSLDEVLTPTACELRRFTTEGAANIPPVELNNRVLFAQRAARDILEAEVTDSVARTTPTRLTALVPEIGDPGFVRMAMQHQPDTRIHCVKSDGTVAILITDPAEDVRCWVNFETDGFVEDVVVMPSGIEDSVYYTVRRTIGGVTKRFFEKFAFESQCVGGAINRQADSHVVYNSGLPTNVITGLDHLEGETVVVWADGTARDSVVVSGGQAAISGAEATQAMAGLHYRGRYKSAKLAYGVNFGTALGQPKRVTRIGLNLLDTHIRAITLGASFDSLQPMPRRRDWGAYDEDEIIEAEDFGGDVFPGKWGEDERFCLEANAPFPATVTGVTLALEAVGRAD